MADGDVVSCSVCDNPLYIEPISYGELKRKLLEHYKKEHWDLVQVIILIFNKK